ncbi:MAG: fimbrillin family protein [Mucinivorans sp.]
MFKRVYLYIVLGCLLCVGCEKRTASPAEKVSLDIQGDVAPIANSRAPFTDTYRGVIGITTQNEWVDGYGKIPMDISQGVITTDPRAVFLSGGTYSFYSIVTSHAKGLTPSLDGTYPLAFGSVSNATTDTKQYGDMLRASVPDLPISQDSRTVNFAYKHIYGQIKVTLLYGGEFTPENVFDVLISDYYQTARVDLRSGKITQVQKAFKGQSIGVDLYYYAIPQEVSAQHPITIRVCTFVGDQVIKVTDPAANVEAGQSKNYQITLSTNSSVDIHMVDWFNYITVDNDFE